MNVARVAWRLWLPIAMLAGWEILGKLGAINTLFFPPPSAIARATSLLLVDGDLVTHLTATLVRTFTGFLIGVVAGLVLGLLMGRSRYFRWSVEPMVSTLVSLPKLALLPLTMLVLGIGETSRIAIIATAAFVVVALQTLDAVRSISLDYVELARNYGARSWQLVRSVYIPAALPQAWTGLRLALGRALGMAIAVEILGARFGLGSLIWSGWQTFKIENIYIGVLAGALVGAVFHVSMRGVEKVMVPWKQTES